MIRTILTFALLAALIGPVHADEAAPGKHLRVVLDLSDGSRIVGVPNVESIRVVTEYADMELALKKVVDVSVESDHEHATVKMQNGDLLKGVINLGPFSLSTLFGETSIGVEHIRHMHVEYIPGKGSIPKGLILWNRLGSEVEVSRSAVGPGGQLNAGRFVKGRSGNGVELTMDEQYGVTFPQELLQHPEGCVEVWAKLIDFNKALPWGNRPGLLASCDAKGGAHFILHFNGNDGAANGGLCARVPGLGNSGTGRFGDWTYARALGAAHAEGWHHYAIVWAENGIPGVGDGTRKMAAFVDGKLNSTTWNGPSGNRLTMPTDGRFGLLSHQGVEPCSIVFDDIKVWNYARTDFENMEQKTK